MKLAGLLLIVLLSTALGASLYDRDRKRIRTISVLCSFIEEMSTGIRYTGSSVEEILLECADNSSYSTLIFLQNVKKEIYASGLRADTLKRALLTETSEMNMNSDEVRPLVIMADKLGTTDIQGQLQMLETCKTQMEELKTKENKRCETLGKMYISLGFLVGLGAAVILA